MRAIILGGTGAIGGAIAKRLLEAGWDVDLSGRDPAAMPDELAAAGARFHRIARSDTAGIERLIGTGAELLVDLVAFSAHDVRQLLPSLSLVAGTVLISSRAVYVDTAGRHINGEDTPRFAAPVPESAPTVSPAGDDVDPFTREGYAPSKVAAELAALDSGLPITVLRAAKVHGRWARNPRTRDTVRAMQDPASTVSLAAESTVDHLVAATNAAALIEVVAGQPGRRILNAADPDAPTAEAIVRSIGTRLGWAGELELVERGTGRGAHPWSTQMTLDMSAAAALGYRPVAGALPLLGEEVDWVREAL